MDAIRRARTLRPTARDLTDPTSPLSDTELSNLLKDRFDSAGYTVYISENRINRYRRDKRREIRERYLSETRGRSHITPDILYKLKPKNGEAKYEQMTHSQMARALSKNIKSDSEYQKLLTRISWPIFHHKIKSILSNYRLDGLVGSADDPSHFWPVHIDLKFGFWTEREQRESALEIYILLIEFTSGDALRTVQLFQESQDGIAALAKLRYNTLRSADEFKSPIYKLLNTMKMGTKDPRYFTRALDIIVHAHNSCIRKRISNDEKKVYLRRVLDDVQIYQTLRLTFVNQKDMYDDLSFEELTILVVKNWSDTSYASSSRQMSDTTMADADDGEVAALVDFDEEAEQPPSNNRNKRKSNNNKKSKLSDDTIQLLSTFKKKRSETRPSPRPLLVASAHQRR